MRRCLFVDKRHTCSMRGRVILYVEDDDAAFSLVRFVLREQDPDLQLLRARDGEQALAILRASPPFQAAPKPDLILLDLNLPKKNGFELLADLKVSEDLRSIPVVVLTTSARRSDRADCLALGAQDYVTKPSNFDSLVEAVKVACSLPGKSSNADSGR